MNTTIVELAQRHADTFQGDGDYSVNLDKPILLTEGCEVSIKSAFLDTRANNSGGDGRITIDETNDQWNLNNVIYIKSYDNTADHLADFEYSADATADATNVPNGRNYTLSYTFGTRPNLLELKEFTLGPLHSYNKLKETDFVITHLNENGVEVNTTLTATTTKTSSNRAKCVIKGQSTTTSDLALLYTSRDGSTEFKSSDFTISGADQLNLENHGFGDGGETKSINTAGISEVVATGQSLQPLEIKTNFSIPRGQYEPDALAVYLTDRLNQRLLVFGL